MDLKIVTTQEILGKEFKIYGTTEEPLFLAKDVATLIEHSNVTMMLNTLEETEKELNNVYTLGGLQQSWFLTEDGLYEVLMQSRKPIAKVFKKEIKIILKQIRQTGGFIPMSETDSDAELMARALLIATKTMELKDARIKNLETAVADNAEKVLLVDSLHLDTSVKIGHLAKTLSIKGLGQNNFFKWLRSEKILLLNNEPTSTYQQHFTLMNHKIDKLGVNKPTTMFKLESLQWLLNRLKRSGYLVNKNYDELMGLLKN